MAQPVRSESVESADPAVLRANLDLLVLKDREDLEAKGDPLDQLAPLVQSDHWDPRVQVDREANLVLQEHREHREPLAHSAQLDLPVNVDRPDPLVRWDLRVNVDPLDLQDLRDPGAQMVAQESQAYPELQDPRV